MNSIKVLEKCLMQTLNEIGETKKRKETIIRPEKMTPTVLKVHFPTYLKDQRSSSQSDRWDWISTDVLLTNSENIPGGSVTLSWT